MKSSAVLASLLFGSFAVAAPVDRRALVYHTEVVTETVVIFTTVYDDDVAEATTTPEGLFYEQHPTTTVVSTSSVVPASTPAVEEPSSVYSAPPAPQAPKPTPTPAYTPAPAPAPEPTTKTTEEAKPTTTETPYVAPTPTPVATTPAPVATTPATEAPAPQPTTPTESNPTTGETYSNVDITIYDNNGGYGACGTALYDTDMIVALAQPAWGASTYDVQTGAATNPWCGQKIQIDYNGNSIQATIMDLCPGCSGHDIDLSLSAWKALTGLDEKTRLQASWSKIS